MSALKPRLSEHCQSEAEADKWSYILAFQITARWKQHLYPSRALALISVTKVHRRINCENTLALESLSWLYKQNNLHLHRQPERKKHGAVTKESHQMLIEYIYGVKIGRKQLVHHPFILIPLAGLRGSPCGAEELFDMCWNRELLKRMSNVLNAFLSCTLKPRVTARSRCSDRCPVSSVHTRERFEAEFLLRDKGSLPTRRHVTFTRSPPFYVWKEFREGARNNIQPVLSFS